MDTNLRQDIEQAFGSVPTFFEQVPEALLAKEWETYKAFELADTALPMKTKELVGLAVAAAIQCPYCTYFHEHAARMHGASDEEVKEAIFMAKHTAGWSSFVRGTNQPLEEFQGEVDRILDYVQSQAGGPRGSPKAGARPAGRSR